jgi:hypothetical protein
MSADDFVPVPTDLPNAVKLAVLGMISGALSWALVDVSDRAGLSFDLEGFGLVLLPVAVYPGLAFGLVVGAFLHRQAKLTWLRTIGYVAAAGLSYVGAFHVAFYIVANGFNHREGALAYIVGGIPAGFAGSLLLGLLTRFLLHVPGRLVLRLPVAIGTVAGALLGLASLDSRGWGFLAFFVLWQGAYGMSLAPLLRGSRPALAG